MMSRGIFFLAALALTACPTGNKCVSNADCKTAAAPFCDAKSGTCTSGVDGGGAGGGGGGAGGGSGGGSTGGGAGGGSTMNNGAETCAAAMLITPGTIEGNTTGKGDDYNPGCTGEVTPGPDTVYKISVPAGQRLQVTATPEVATTGNQYDLAVYLIEGPESNCTNADGGTALTCLGAADRPRAAAETTSYVNRGTTAVDVFVVIDSVNDAMTASTDGGIGTSQQGKFTLVTTLSAPPGGDTCASAITLTAGTPLMNQNLGDYGNDYEGQDTGSPADCFGSPAGDIAYQVTVNAGEVLSLVVTPEATFDPGISVSESAAACDVTCLKTVDVGGNGRAETYSYRNTGTAPKTLFLVVDGYAGSTGTFTIAATVSTPPADDTCAGPIALTSGAALTGQTFANYTNDYTSASGTDCSYAGGPDRAYSINVGPGDRLVVTVTPSTMADPALNLVDGAANCDMQCLVGTDVGFRGDPETILFTNTSGVAQSYLVVVDFYSSSTGTFDIVANVGPPPAGDVCNGPVALATGASLTAQTTINYSNDYANPAGVAPCSSSGTSGGDKVYAISVPPNQRGVVTVTPSADGGYDPSLNLVEGAAAVCSATPRLCVAGSNAAHEGEPETVSLFNTTGTAKSVFAIVDGTTEGEFNIAYTTGTPGVDDTCTTNTTVAAGTQNHNLTGFVTDYNSGTNCLGFAGPDRVYKVAALGANQKYSVTLTPTGADGGLDPVIGFITGTANTCDVAPRTCLGGVDLTLRNQAESGAFTNNTAAAIDLYVVVADYELSSTNRDYSLVSTVGAATAGESCQLPLVAAAGVLAAQNTVAASADVIFAPTSTGCIPTFPLPDKVYQVAIPAGQTMTFTATPAGQEDMAVNVIDGPASSCNNVTACLASANVGIKGDPEVARYLNGSMATKTVFVQVSGLPASGSVVNYSVTLTVQ